MHAIPDNLSLSLGVIDGRNIWKNDFQQSLELINRAITKIGTDRVFIAPSCSLLHVPCDLEIETEREDEIRQWLAFAKQKLEELIILKKLASPDENKSVLQKLVSNQVVIESRKTSGRIHNAAVNRRYHAISEADTRRESNFAVRKDKQHKALNLPLFPTTTIGSFPQTIWWSTSVNSWPDLYSQKTVGYRATKAGA